MFSLLSGPAESRGQVGTLKYASHRLMRRTKKGAGYLAVVTACLMKVLP